MNTFSDKLLDWYRLNGRHDLPWQHPRSLYRCWISETMLQQTQVVTVIPYFQRFMVKYPDVESLATANIDDVLGEWSGLGYYARARNLHKTAKLVVEKFAGVFPADVEQLEQLPGIGRSTAAAIVAQACNQRQPILDGNVKRVLSRYFQVDGWPGQTAVTKQLWQLSDDVTPTDNAADYTQAIMDLGATLCKRSKPCCTDCPLSEGCQAYASGVVSQYPHPKPKKAKPRKERTMPIVVDGEGRILLQRRPGLGIWGGLWSLPEFEQRDDLQQWAGERRYLEQRQLLPDLKHEFSHYSLLIKPMLLRCDEENLVRIADDEEHWQALDVLLSEQQKTPLPAPIRKLLQAFRDTEISAKA